MKSSYPEKSIYYVYALLDPRKQGPFYYGNWKFSHEPFYIGKGKGTRLNAHQGSKGGNKQKINKIAKIQREGYKVIRIVKINNLIETKAYLYEEKLVTKIGRLDLKTGPLTNLTDGGIGCLNSPKANEKIRIAALNQHAKMTKKEKRQYINKLKAGHKNMPLEKKLTRSINSSIAQRKRFSNTTKEQKNEISRKQQATFNARTEEQKNLHYQRLSEKATLAWKRIESEELVRIKTALNKSFERRRLPKRFIL